MGFEPTLEFPLNTLSKRAPSATRPSLRKGAILFSSLPEEVEERDFRGLDEIVYLIARSAV